MLVLSRKSGQRIVIDERIVITFQRITNGRVSLTIKAPRDVSIRRGELEPRKEAA